MGNAGSNHNLHNDCTENELNSYYMQQYLKKTIGETKKKCNQIALGGWSSGGNVSDCKVLPKPTENLKLRATSNGAILQAGGTISFRAKEQKGFKKIGNLSTNETNDLAAFYPMRRFQTLILDGQNESIAQRKSDLSQAEFRRSQTLLHVGYNKPKTYDSKFAQPKPPNVSTTSTVKVNKYNKKRKAPPAPTKVPLGSENTISGKNYLTDTKSTSLSKTRIYSTYSSKQQQQIHKIQPQATKIISFQRDINTRTSIKSYKQIPQSDSSGTNKLPYRREKSFDAVLLRQRPSNDANDKRPQSQNSRDFVNKLEEELHDGNHKRKPFKQPGNTTSNKIITNYRSNTNYLKDTHNPAENFPQEDKKSNQFGIVNTTEPEYHNVTTNGRQNKHQQSRIPQLKRTFYFGMESSNKTPIVDSLQTKTTTVPCKANKTSDESKDMMLANHNIESEEEIIDNGILVHVRPTLPRRQLETPSFNPTAAWRNLLQEQLHLQQQKRNKQKQNSVNCQRVIETPICLTSELKQNKILTGDNWTPQQDLEDDDDEDGAGDDDDDDNDYAGNMNDKEQKCKTRALESDPAQPNNSLHIFSLSLPRDVHLQCQMKSSLDYTEQENSFKATNSWLVPGFNSLQKFKTQLGKSVLDSRSNTKCTCAANAITIKRNSYHVNNIFGETISNDSKINHQPDCQLIITLPRPSSTHHNDNWLLHKSKSNDVPLHFHTSTQKLVEENCSEVENCLNSRSLVSLQPKSLANIYCGKHIVYLPGQDTRNPAIKNNHNKNPKQTKKTTKSIYKRQRQRHETVRESLQDLTPIPTTMQQSNISVSEKNTHRFSFQSTVRVLEKRRLAEKLSKDAEIQEAQRLNELEAMKRVEEDFQRKRAPEKANLRNQLRLHLKSNTENKEYQSLPLNINDRHNNEQTQNQHITSDLNNNLFCRAEPDGAVSPTLDLDYNTDLTKSRHSNFSITPTTTTLKYEKCFEFDLEESESEAHVPTLKRTALLTEPYLHSII